MSQHVDLGLVCYLRANHERFPVLHGGPLKGLFKLLLRYEQLWLSEGRLLLLLGLEGEGVPVVLLDELVLEGPDLGQEEGRVDLVFLAALMLARGVAARELGIDAD